MFEIRRLACIALATVGLLCATTHAAPTSRPANSSHVFLDGAKTLVRWSDGDTFRVLAGKARGVKARLQGFNTLESYGPVHRWGQWQGQGLAKIADRATAFVRRGTWRCTSRGKRDRYHRVLVACPGLAKALIARGLAHAFGPPKDATWLAAQARAIQQKRGMWAKGAPSHLLTSVHSTSEGKSPTYNRLVSTRTGGFQIIHHKRHYKSCQWVCSRGACLLYVPYKRRYGQKRAKCLR